MRHELRAQSWLKAAFGSNFEQIVLTLPDEESLKLHMW